MPGTMWCGTFMGARDRTRTDKDVNPIEPETIASTNFATRALRSAKVVKIFCNKAVFHHKIRSSTIFSQFQGVHCVKFWLKNAIWRVMHAEGGGGC